MKKSSRPSKVTFVSEKPERNFKSVYIFVLLVAMSLSAVYLYFKNGYDDGRRVANQNQVQNQATEEQKAVSVQPGTPETLIDKIKRHLVVSEADIPYIATITNIELVKQKNPDFYKDAKDGDKVVVWKDRAVIYSEADDRIVAVATSKPLLVAPDVSADKVQEQMGMNIPSVEQQMASTTIEVRNGSRKNGAAKALKQQLETLGLNVTKVGDTVKTYQGTQIIDFSEQKAPAVMDLLMKSTSGTVMTGLPEGEKPTTAQVLILIGR